MLAMRPRAFYADLIDDSFGLPRKSTRGNLNKHCVIHAELLHVQFTTLPAAACFALRNFTFPLFTQALFQGPPTCIFLLI